MSIRNTFPEQRPTLNLDFANSKTLDPRITFTRTSTATYVDEDGLIKSVDADVARFDHDPITGECLGLLVEEGRSNLITYSEQFDNVAWTTTYYTVGIDSTTAPDGTTSAEKLIRNTTNTLSQINRNITGTSTNTTYTLSCFCKSAEWSKIGLREGVATGYWTTFDLSVGEEIDSSAGTTSTITPYPNGWYRISMTLTTTGTQTSYGVRIIPLPDSYTSGTPFVNQSGNDVDGLYLWGAQLEEGAFPTSYIPRPDTSTATRNPDTVSITGTNFTKWSSDLEGTLGVTVIPTNETSVNVVRFKGAGGGGDNIRYIRQNSSNVFDAASQTTYPSGPSNYSGAGDAILNEDNTIFIGYSESNDVFKIIKDGNSLVTKTGLASIESFALYLGGGRDLFKKIIFYPYLLSDSQLQTLTK